MTYLCKIIAINRLKNRMWLYGQLSAYCGGKYQITKDEFYLKNGGIYKRAQDRVFNIYLKMKNNL